MRAPPPASWIHGRRVAAGRGRHACNNKEQRNPRHQRLRPRDHAGAGASSVQDRRPSTASRSLRRAGRGTSPAGRSTPPQSPRPPAAQQATARMPFAPGAAVTPARQRHPPRPRPPFRAATTEPERPPGFPQRRRQRSCRRRTGESSGAHRPCGTNLQPRGANRFGVVCLCACCHAGLAVSLHRPCSTAPPMLYVSRARVNPGPPRRWLQSHTTSMDRAVPWRRVRRRWSAPSSP